MMTFRCVSLVLVMWTPGTLHVFVCGVCVRVRERARALNVSKSDQNANWMDVLTLFEVASDEGMSTENRKN